MIRHAWIAIVGLAGLLAMAPPARGQARPYIGFVYPAGGQQGTTFQIRLGGQGLDGVSEVLVSGSGVEAKLIEYQRKLNPQEITLLREQLNELRRASPAKGKIDQKPGKKDEKPGQKDQQTQDLIAKLEKRMAEHVLRPASDAVANLVIAEVTVAPDAEPGARELILGTLRGVSNPLVFHVGQLPEVSRKPMITSPLQVLGKEELALRKRPEDEAEDLVTTPCTVNGQIASGEENRYRFKARRGQRLVISTDARTLIPYIADAVPGWFQPVVALYDADGKEVAYADDYRFKPDPVILYRVPRNGDYVLSIHDALYRGREDFVYRVTLGELPFVTSIFPLGSRFGQDDPPTVAMTGWNVEKAELALPPKDARPGNHLVAATGRDVVSNRVPFISNFCNFFNCLPIRSKSWYRFMWT